jgi:hypothetical protein
MQQNGRSRPPADQCRWPWFAIVDQMTSLPPTTANHRQPPPTTANVPLTPPAPVLPDLVPLLLAVDEAPSKTAWKGRLRLGTQVFPARSKVWYAYHLGPLRELIGGQ